MILISTLQVSSVSKLLSKMNNQLDHQKTRAIAHFSIGVYFRKYMYMYMYKFTMFQNNLLFFYNKSLHQMHNFYHGLLHTEGSIFFQEISTTFPNFVKFQDISDNFSRMRENVLIQLSWLLHSWLYIWPWKPWSQMTLSLSLTAEHKFN